MQIDTVLQMATAIYNGTNFNQHGPFNQQKMNYSQRHRYQQSSLKKEGRRTYGTAPASVDSYPKRAHGNELYDQGDHSERQHRKSVNQLQHPQPGFQTDTKSQQQFRNQQTTCRVSQVFDNLGSNEYNLADVLD